MSLFFFCCVRVTSQLLSLPSLSFEQQTCYEFNVWLKYYVTQMKLEFFFHLAGVFWRWEVATQCDLISSYCKYMQTFSSWINFQWKFMKSESAYSISSFLIFQHPFNVRESKGEGIFVFLCNLNHTHIYHVFRRERKKNPSKECMRRWWVITPFECRI